MAALLASTAAAQMPAYTQAGPMPPALAAAKTIFVSNAGSDSGLFPYPFAGDPDRTYTEFYAALKAAGAFTLVSKPDQADLVLELRLIAPSVPGKGNEPPYVTPMFRLVVYGRKSHYILWTVTKTIDSAVLEKSRDKNFDTALASVLGQFLLIAGKKAP